MNKHTIILGLSVGCMLTACTTGQTEGEREVPKKTPDEIAAVTSGSRVRPVPQLDSEVSTAPRAAGSEASLGPGLRRLADLAKQDLSNRLGVEKTEIETLSAEYVTWRDSSVGCPEPGYEYMQVLTNGSRITLQVKNQIYYYHSGGKRPPFLCEHPSPIDPLPYAPGEA